MLCKRILVSLLLIGVCSFVLLANVFAAAEESGYKKWCKHRDELKKDPSVVRFYTFEEGEKDIVKNLASGGKGKSDLCYVYMDNETTNILMADNDLEYVEGRFPEKKAIRLDKYSLVQEGYKEGQQEGFNIENKSITIELWIKRIGKGVHTGGYEKNDGFIVRLGGGRDGWSIFYAGYLPVYVFSIGRPEPDNGIVVNSKSITDKEWYHLVAVWDGSKMKIYLNGKLSGIERYNGDYTPSASDFFLGYARAAKGSNIVDIDEVIIYNRALTPEEIEKNYQIFGVIE